MEYKDYYKTLQLERTATAEEIKKAFRKLARKYHPDVSKEANAEAQMKEINEAYAVLSDPEKKLAYDQLGTNYRAGQDFRPPPGWDAGFEFTGPNGESADEFFADLFSHMAGAKRPPKYKARGEDHHAKIFVDLVDSYSGATHPFSLHASQRTEHGEITLKERALQVKIPRGVKEGQHIRLMSEGGAGFNGGPAGDLYLEVHFKPDTRYSVDGRDVYAKTPVAPWEAAIGATIEVSTPAGRVQVGIPASSQSGRKLRLKGKGLPGEPAGDLYLVLEVVLPPATTEKARRLYETMAKEMPFDPRATMGA